MKGWLLLVAAFLLCPSCSSPNEITCNPPRISNGSFRPQRAIYQDGDLIRIHCDPGYDFEPHNAEKVVECTRNGWSPSPKCVEITCNPPGISNGSFRPQRTIYQDGDLIQIQCDPGFNFEPHNAEKVVECTRNGWSRSPKCVDTTCPEPPTVENAIIMEDRREKYLPGQKINYQCNDGFELSGSATVTCTEKKWLHLPRCEDVSCISPPQIENGRINGLIKERYLPLEKVSYRCHSGYSLIGRSYVTCVKKLWTEKPHCADMKGKCGRPPLVDDADVLQTLKSTYSSYEFVTYQCQNRYTMEGSPRVTCQNGHWSQAPTCRVPCTASEEDMRKNNIILKWKDSDKIYSEAGNTVEFQCKRGYHPHPNSRPFRVRCVDGKFQYPHCIYVSFDTRDCQNDCSR